MRTMTQNVTTSSEFQEDFDAGRASKIAILHFLPQMRITAAEPGKVNFELPIEKHHTNRLGILHGATLATLVDTSGSLAVASRGLYATGVSTDLSVTYLNSGGKIGDLVKGEVICDKCEKTRLLVTSESTTFTD